MYFTGRPRVGKRKMLKPEKLLECLESQLVLLDWQRQLICQAIDLAREKPRKPEAPGKVGRGAKAAGLTARKQSQLHGLVGLR